MQDAGGLRLRPGLHIGRAADDHRGHRQRAEQPADRVARALRHQLLVVVRARPVGHPVDRRGAEEALRGRDEGEGEHGAEDGQLGQAAEFTEAGRLDRRQQAVHLHLGDGQREHRRHEGGDGDRGERAGHHTDLRGHPLPQHEEAEGAHADRERGEGLGTAGDPGGEAGQPGDLAEAAAGLVGIGHRIHLAEDEDQSDPRQHALDHGDGYRPEPPAAAQRAEDQLQDAGREHDGAQGRHAELLHGLMDEHREPGGGAADLERTARQTADDEAADDAGDQPEFGRHSRGDGHTDTQRDGDEKDDERGERVTAERAGRQRGKLGCGALERGEHGSLRFGAYGFAHAACRVRLRA